MDDNYYLKEAVKELRYISDSLVSCLTKKTNALHMGEEDIHKIISASHVCSGYINRQIKENDINTVDINDTESIVEDRILNDSLEEDVLEKVNNLLSHVNYIIEYKTENKTLDIIIKLKRTT